MTPSEVRAAADRIRRIRDCVEKSQDIYGVSVGDGREAIHEAARIVKRKMLDDERLLIDYALATVPADGDNAIGFRAAAETESRTPIAVGAGRGDDAITIEQEILPCPFCGGAPFVSESDDGIPRWVSCWGCDSDGPPIDYKFDGTADEARKIVVKAWNQRSANHIRRCKMEGE